MSIETSTLIVGIIITVFLLFVLYKYIIHHGIKTINNDVPGIIISYEIQFGADTISCTLEGFKTVAIAHYATSKNDPSLIELLDIDVMELMDQTTKKSIEKIIKNRLDAV